MWSLTNDHRKSKVSQWGTEVNISEVYDIQDITFAVLIMTRYQLYVLNYSTKVTAKCLTYFTKITAKCWTYSMRVTNNWLTYSTKMTTKCLTYSTKMTTPLPCSSALIPFQEAWADVYSPTSQGSPPWWHTLPFAPSHISCRICRYEDFVFIN